ncbi:VWA domain-containing protein [bacterium]|nr:VWA domain-containing protein [bacterium]
MNLLSTLGLSNLRFVNPEFLLLMLLAPYIVYWGLRKDYGGRVKFSSLDLLGDIKPSWRTQWRKILPFVRAFVIVFLSIAMARPQAGREEQKVYTEGVDIILILDTSTSMRAEDFKPQNRLGAAKMVAKEFVQGRENDRIGLVVFAGKSFTQCPLTLDYGIILNFIDQTEIGMIEDGTAIGMAIANAVNRLKDSKAKSKVIILLTDGRNNRGEIDPVTAAKLANTFDIKIYSIGAGKRGYALYPVDHPFFGKQYQRMPVEIDEETLREVARITGGKYFRATDTEKLRGIYKEIDSMEKTKIEVKNFMRYKELFTIFLVIAGLFLLLDIWLRYIVFKKIP